MDIEPLIKEAQRLLKANPRDDIHDLSHHLRVWEKVKIIVSTLDEPVSLDVLKISTFWHDVMIRPESLSLGSEGLFMRL